MRSLAMVGIVCLFAACSESYDRPLDPVWGKQPCAHCAMLVTEARYSAQLTTQDPERIWFDDIGCLIAYIADRKPKVAHLWVHDAVTPRWLDATATRYQDGAKTPMDFGFVAGAKDGVDFATMQRTVLARMAAKDQALDHH